MLEGGDSAEGSLTGTLVFEEDFLKVVKVEQNVLDCNSELVDYQRSHKATISLDILLNRARLKTGIV